ncbi:2-C-methyl-D-erythritol 4-phosphate cytidylyltransferase [Mycobacterium sp. ACS1612]|uniref:IspD/TarI family cytidylyltransferase n=1 Tax=Mycobacterium sp. ACS1612 TaxID=1834117 RepID=UPI0007FD50E9|nr:IspD/TarI family cytidylyltransferase [Mycobacterium sp. ACS1612]OBF31293.1 2-C-methyl-D-erythritol 4-phosphate cytidylyltransferase [Mycobacterium sp. ACS1612]
MRRYAVGVVLAAGLGTRVGAEGNKAYLPLAGRSMVAWSLGAVAAVEEIARTVLVYRKGELDLARDTVAAELPDTAVELVEGGDTRHASEFNVLRYLADDIESGAVDVVLIHDAARPLAASGMFVNALSLAREFGGAIPALAIADVVHQRPAGVEAIGSALVRVQTPQAFRARPLLRAYLAADADGFEGTDTSSCIEKYTDEQVRTFPGEQANLKVTYATDVAVAARLLTGAGRR